MGRFVDLVGMTFGRLTVIENMGLNWQGTYMWKCRCECGNESIIKTGSLKGTTRSCGCLVSDANIKRFTTHGHTAFKGHNSSEYNSWSNMKARCYKPSTIRFENYGGRGITVCDRWKNSFENFLEDMGLKPTPKHSIDRIDVNGNYEPNNCRWATTKQQACNTRRNRHITYNGETKLLVEWAKELNVGYMTLTHHLRTKSMDDIIAFYKNKTPGISNVGLKCIGYDHKKRLYRVNIRRGDKRYGKRFKDINDAIKYRDELLKTI